MFLVISYCYLFLDPKQYFSGEGRNVHSCKITGHNGRMIVNNNEKATS